jgi:NitT/TauT family transport system substrate-binding protein
MSKQIVLIQTFTNDRSNARRWHFRGLGRAPESVQIMRMRRQSFTFRWSAAVRKMCLGTHGVTGLEPHAQTQPVAAPTTALCGLPDRFFATVLFASLFTVPACADELWRHGTLVPKGDAGFIYMAAEGGFANAQGLELRMQAFPNDTLMMKALIAGELESYEGSPVSPLIAGSKGADVKILGCTWPKLTYSLFSREGIGTIADLKGKKLAISAAGSLPDLVARAMLKKAGIAPSEVTFVAAGSDADRVRALTARIVDATVSTSDFAARPELKLKTLAVASDAVPQFLRQCLIVRGDLIRSKRVQLVAFMTAEMNAYGFACTHRDEVVALTRRIANLAPGDSVADASYRDVIEQRAASPAIEIDLDRLRWLRDLLAEDGRMAAKFDPAALTDPSIREEALVRAR